jgi:hypothetical protein
MLAQQEISERFTVGIGKCFGFFSVALHQTAFSLKYIFWTAKGVF